MQRHGHDGARVQIHRVFGLLRQVRPPVFHLRDPCVLVRRTLPLFVRGAAGYPTNDFLSFLDILYAQILAVWEEIGLFQQPRLITPIVVTSIELRIMNDVGFIGYVGSPDFHDGVVLRVSVEGKTAEVVVKGYSGREHVVLFEGVDAVEINAPEGMVLVFTL